MHMPATVTEEFWRAAGVLFLMLLAHIAYTATKAAGEKLGRRNALFRALGVVCGIALFSALVMGSPSCSSSDGRGCDEYNDDGWNPTDAQRAGRFVFLTMVLGVPAMFGLFEARRTMKHPWRKPQQGEELSTTRW